MSIPTPGKPAPGSSEALVTHLKHRGLLRDSRLEAAFRAVPRHLFLPDLPPDEVYVDEAIPTRYDLDGRVVSSSSQPSMMAMMLEQLDLQPGQNVLEIGTGTGYNAALLQHIVGAQGKVTTIEFDPTIARQAADHLQRARFNSVLVVTGDGAAGYAPRAAYDRIICTAGIWDVPNEWITQLKPDGYLVTPLALDGAQVSARFQVRRGSVLESSQNIPCGFVLMQGAAAPPGDYHRVGSTALVIAGDQIDRVDTAALHALLSTDQDACLLSEALTSAEVWRGLAIYIMLNHPPEYTFVQYAVSRDQQAFGIEGAGIALFSPGSACLIPFGDQGLTHCFAGSDAFMMAEKLLAQWLAAGRPTTDHLHLRLEPARPASPEPKAPAQGRVYRRQHHDLYAWLETEQPAASAPVPTLPADPEQPG